MGSTQTFSSEVQIQGQGVPCYGWSISVGSYGQLGRATIKTTATKLAAATPPIVIKNLSNGGLVPDVSILMNGQKIFGGLYLDASGPLEENEINLVARDYAGSLFDTKRSLADLGQLAGVSAGTLDANGIGFGSVTLQTLVTLIGQLGNFSLGNILLNIPTALKSVPVGVTRTDQPTSVLAMTPHSLWGLLVYLARMTGCQVYTTPNRQLVFEQVSSGPTAHALSWRCTPKQLAAMVPPAPAIRNLHFLHQPTRNRSFVSLATTHDQRTGITTTASTAVIDSDEYPIAGGTGTLPKGTYTAGAPGQVQNSLSARGLGLPVYQTFKQGYSVQDIQQLAAGNAADIASKLVVFTAVIGGNLLIKPLDVVAIGEGVPGALLGFANDIFYVNSVTHHYDVPQGDHVSNTGFLTTLKLLNLPPPPVTQAQLSELFNNAG